MPLQTIHSALAELGSAQALTIRDSWDGLSMTAPHVSCYTLAKEDEQFTGPATFSITSSLTRQAKRDLSIPSATIHAFLEELATMVVAEGAYTPLVSHTDDYPSIQIQIMTTAGILGISSQSQGTNHTPWAITFQGRSYISDSPAPQHAWEELKASLHAETLQELITVFEREGAATRAAIPSPVAVPCQPPSGTPPPLTLPGAPPGRAVAPTPQLALGQTINLVEYLGLSRAQSLRLLGLGMEDARYGQGIISDPAQIQLIVAALNQPTTIVASATGSDRAIELRGVVLNFNLGTTTVSLTYNPQRQTIERFTAQPQFTVAAPPGFLESLAKLVCRP